MPYPNNTELFIGIVAPVGVDLEQTKSVVEDYLKQYKYNLINIRLSRLIKNINDVEINNDSEYERISSLMSGGNKVREKASRNDILACLAMYEIKNKRKDNKPNPNCAYLLNSLKHPEEAYRLREIYGDGFYLIGVSSSYTNKLNYLSRKGISRQDADRLIERDEAEDKPHGQNTRKTFQLADVFIDFDKSQIEKQIDRVLKLIFGCPVQTPTKDEYAMFLAFAASLRSADLSRQVGAVLMSKEHEVIATGANDVPRFGGGLYWDDDDNDNRDHIIGEDTNETHRDDFILKIMKKFNQEEMSDGELIEEGKKLLKDTGILDITEYGRPVHAEMECLLSCARSGVNPKNGTLYCTTFPCHNCTKHIIASGVKRVVFIEPYPKSKAKTLYAEEISLVAEENLASGKVSYEPFVGVGPRKFVVFFSMTLSRGRYLKRKNRGKTIDFNKKDATVRIPLSPLSYIDKESILVNEMEEQLKGGEDGSNQADQ